MPLPTPARHRVAARATRVPGARLLVLLAAALAGHAGPAAASPTGAVSSNWSGYALTGASYSSVSGSWRQPRANCASAAGEATDSAFWVGLGGNSASASALEQAGTEADCTAAGAARYSAWFELVPAASVKLPLAVSPGDRISASVRVEGHRVSVAVRNLTSGKRVARTLVTSAPATSSAEWIAEAPSLLTATGSAVLPLTDFGSVVFSHARATALSGHAGTISDHAWTATAITLETGGGGPDRLSRFSAQVSAAQAVPGPLRSGGSAFRVSLTLQTSPAPPAAGGPATPSFAPALPAQETHSRFTGIGARIPA
jgi:hypothetical protein